MIYKIKQLKKRYFEGINRNNISNIIVAKQSSNEINKKPYRYDIINFLIKNFNRDTNYLEIGVYSDEDLNKINSTHRRDGFETSNADKIFESTYQKQVNK